MHTLFVRMACCCLLALLHIGTVHAGNPGRLLHKIRGLGDTPEKVALLNDLSSDYNSEDNWEMGRRYGYKALALAKKIGDQPGTARACMNLGLAYSYRENAKALAFFRASLKQYKELGRKTEMANAYINIGSLYDDMADYGNALKCYSYAIRQAKRTHDIDLEADVSLNAGITYYAIGDYPAALKMHYRALKLYDRMNKLTSRADVRNCLGNVYADQGNDSMALTMYYSSLALSKRAKDKLAIANACINIGLIYTEQQQYEAAAAMNRRALTYFTESEDYEGAAISYNNLATLHYKKGQYPEALSMCDRALASGMKAEDPVECTNANVIRAQVYIGMRELGKARALLMESLRTNIGMGHKLHIKDTYKVLVELDSASNDYAAAFRDYKLWALYSDSINNEESDRKGFQTALQYDFDKKALEEKRRHDSAIGKLATQNRLSNQRQQFLILLLTFFVVAMIAIWIFVRRAGAASKKYAAVLANENAHKEALLQEVHHRVNNSLQMISSLLAMQADTSNNAEVTEYLLKSENRIQAMSVMHRLLHLGNSKLEVDIREYLGSVLDFYSDLLETQPGVRMNVALTQQNFHTKIAMPLGLILNELITNALKYAFPDSKGNIDVSLEQVPDSREWVFRVADDGTGFTQWSQDNAESGIGLQLVRLMARQLNGNLEISGENGMEVVIRFGRTAK